MSLTVYAVNMQKLGLHNQRNNDRQIMDDREILDTP